MSERDAERLYLGDQQCGEERAGNAAHAANNNHHERIADRRDVLAEIGGLARQVQCAAETGESRTERKYAGEKHRLIDPECRDHIAVLRGGADQNAPARAGEQKP